MKELNFKLAVIGGGGAGLAAVLTAMKDGVDAGDIALVEKRPFIGGNSGMAGGQLFATGTRTQREKGEVVSTDKIFRDTMSFHHYSRVEPKILRMFLENGADTVAWMEELGYKYYDHQLTNYMVDGPKPFGNFHKVLKTMAERFTEAGGTILKNTGAESVKRDGDGWRITAKDKEGELEILAKALIITTGGFGGNRELMYKYFPDQYDDNYYTDAILHTGDGLKLAEDAGVALTDYCTIIKENAYSTTSYKDAPNRAAHEPRSLWVNGYGERFCDETNAMDNLSTNALVRQPGKVGYAMFDSDIMEYTSTHRPAMMPEGLELPNVRLQFEEEVRRNGNEWAIISDSLDEIAHWIGADRDVFEETVEKYNSDCEAGRDSLFAKEPQYLMPLKKAPYYAIKFRPILIDTVGPIVVDEKMQALGDDHRPVPGVYAAGVITSGWQGVDYTLHGSALCYSLTSGRMAGASAAKYLSK